MDLVTLAKAKGYTDISVEGLGVIKGANCEVESITPITGGNKITLSWTGSAGTKLTDSFDVMDGYSITDIEIDEYDHLICTLSNGTLVDAGKLPEEKVKISSVSGNIITQKSDGLYVPSSPVEISKETGNAITQKSDGLYVADVQGVEISKESGNIIQGKADGLYAAIEFETEDIDFNSF